MNDKNISCDHRSGNQTYLKQTSVKCLVFLVNLHFGQMVRVCFTKMKYLDKRNNGFARIFTKYFKTRFLAESNSSAVSYSVKIFHVVTLFLSAGCCASWETYYNELKYLEDRHLHACFDSNINCVIFIFNFIFCVCVRFFLNLYKY